VTDPKFLIAEGTVASVSKKHLRAFEGLVEPIIRIERRNTSLCSHLRQPYRKSLNLNFKVPCSKETIAIDDDKRESIICLFVF